jgi:hypothetical protein
LEAPGHGQRIGYVRVSTLDQNKKTQLGGQVLDRVFTDKAFGRDTQLTNCCGSPVTGTPWPWTAWTRNLVDLPALVQGLTCNGVPAEFVKESLVFTDEGAFKFSERTHGGEDSPMANLMLSGCLPRPRGPPARSSPSTGGRPSVTGTHRR